MSHQYRPVDWNRQKRRYDLTLLVALAFGLALFTAFSLVRSPSITAETLIIRWTSLSAFILLHVILWIGPMARLNPRFLPLLYNRRHLGVVMFLLALVHSALAVFQFHALGDENPLVSIFTAYRRDYLLLDGGKINIAHFPFEPFGLAALFILFLMAATSHDFWLKNLGSAFWKAMHLGVYAAYGLIIVHVAFGALQTERSPGLTVLLGIGFALTTALHLAAARKESGFSSRSASPPVEGFVKTCRVDELQEAAGKVVMAGKKRVALFLLEGVVYATSNVCRHQGGPIGEGRIVDGCITCPWHGWNYKPQDGCSPPPFKEVIETYETRVKDGHVWISPTPNPLGATCAGSRLANQVA